MRTFRVDFRLCTLNTHHKIGSAGIAAAQLGNCVHRQMQIHRAVTAVGQSAADVVRLADAHRTFGLQYGQSQVAMIDGL